MVIKQITQYVYEKEKNISEINGNIASTISNASEFIYEIGIQTLPGIKINLNGNPIIIGKTGIFNLNTKDFASISSIGLNEDNLVAFDTNGNINNDMFYLIIDIITYDEEGK